MIRTTLKVPALPRPSCVPEGVFDDFGWCESDLLEWGRPEASVRAWDERTPIDGADPARMVFVMHAECTYLPREIAALHATGMDLGDAWALAPYGIDDATDELWKRRARPRDVLWLAADNLNALAWGLHDWAHFHNHGPFVERAFTELACDASALAWLWHNREAIGLSAGTWERARDELSRLSASRFRDEGKTFDTAWLDAARLRALLPDAA